jgi:hypothetical protein
MNTLTTYATALAIAIAIAASYNLDGPDDHQAEWDQSEALKDLQASQAGTARRDAAAQALCSQARGPNSEARWTPEGHLVCTTRRGLVTVATMQVQP